MELANIDQTAVKEKKKIDKAEFEALINVIIRTNSPVLNNQAFGESTYAGSFTYNDALESFVSLLGNYINSPSNTSLQALKKPLKAILGLLLEPDFRSSELNNFRNLLVSIYQETEKFETTKKAIYTKLVKLRNS